MYNKTVLITGATSGIGLSTAEYLNGQGYNLILVGRNCSKLDFLCSKFNSAIYFVLDLENISDIYKLFDFIIEQNIRLDGMVHAAGYAVNNPIRSYSLEHMEKQMRVHYYSFVELMKNFYNRKISNDGASIIGISSLASVIKQNGSVLYASSKEAMNTAVVVASKEFIKRSIRVNAILPAYVDTRINEGLEELIDIKLKQPMGLIPPSEIAELVGFLLSSKSKYITGALIPVSAGMEF